MGTTRKRKEKGKKEWKKGAHGKLDDELGVLKGNKNVEAIGTIPAFRRGLHLFQEDGPRIKKKRKKRSSEVDPHKTSPIF